MAQKEDAIRYQVTLSEFAARPIYYFDTSVLLNNVVALADWNPARLEAAITPRVERVLEPADIRIATHDGFYIVFHNPPGEVARHRADAIRNDLLRHFYGPKEWPHEVADKFCQPSSAQGLACSLGIKAKVQRVMKLGGTVGRAAKDESGDDQAPRFSQELQLIFDSAVNSRATGFGSFAFWPIWDGRKDRITTFFCSPDLPLVSSGGDGASPMLADSRCRFDVAALGAATRGIAQIRSRGEVAAVSVAVHVETLTWTKTRNAYLEVLHGIDPQFLGFLAPRIAGLSTGVNSRQIAQWVKNLRRHVQWVFVHLPHVDIELSTHLGIAGCGLTLAHQAHVDTTWLDALSKQAAKLRSICAYQKTSACIDNVVSPLELTLLRDVGVRFLSGTAIGLPSDLPNTLKPMHATASGDHQSNTEHDTCAVK